MPQIYIPWQIGMSIMKSLPTFDVFVNADLLIDHTEDDQ